MNAREAFERGDLAKAKRLASTTPDDFDSKLLLGVIAVREKRWQDGLPLLKEVAERQPESAVAPYWLSMLYRRIGRPSDAMAMAELAVSRAPDEAQNHNQVGLCLLDVERGAEAEASFRKAIQLAPTAPGAYENLGRALQSQGQSQRAVDAFRQSLTTDPRQVHVLCQLGQAALLELDYSVATECAAKALEIDPKSPSAHLLMAKAAIGDRAWEHLEQVLKASPNSPEALTQCAAVYQSLGRLEESGRLLKRSIEIEPRQGFAYYAIVRNRQVDQAMIAQMERLLADPALSIRHRPDLYYALGLVREANEDYESAMAHFNDANRIVRRQRFGDARFDPTAFSKQANLAVRAEISVNSELPIFVVGMMRSGTTLVEQILSSHCEIGAAGERKFRPDESYLANLQRIAPDKRHVVDKMPGNYARLGEIHGAFPNARIVHIQRNPIDTCLSIWSTPNGARIEWANDKANIVFAYEEYLRLMEHWRGCIPSDRMIEVRYEDLVNDREAQTRRLIEFLGVGWDGACLHPEKNDRAVATPSVLQVRRPVYASSIGRWRRFEPWLGEFARLNHG